MIKQYPTLTALLLLVTFFTACQKEVSIDSGNNGANSSNGYQPSTPGSYWKYKDSATGSFFTLTVLDSTATFDNMQYHVVNSESDNESALLYWTTAGSRYYMRSNFQLSTGNAVAISISYLDDAAAVGTSWQTSTSINGLPATIKTTILEKNISKTVNGKTYSNVIHSGIDLTYNLLGMGSLTENLQYYVAKGVGVIRTEASFSSDLLPVPVETTASELVEYSIK